MSDAIGTRRTFTWLWGLGVPLYLAMPFAAHMLPQVLVDGPLMDPSLTQLVPLGVFYMSVMLAISTFGGSAAVCPAYVSDLFGSKYVGAIHGQVLSFLIIAGYLGPLTCSFLRDFSMRTAIADLAAKITPERFAEVFGAPITELDTLITTKTVTIPRLMEIMPLGTQDPTPFLYDYTMITMASLQLLGLMCNLAIRKVDPKFYEQPPQIQSSSSTITIDINSSVNANTTISSDDTSTNTSVDQLVSNPRSSLIIEDVTDASINKAHQDNPVEDPTRNDDRDQGNNLSQTTSDKTSMNPKG